MVTVLPISKESVDVSADSCFCALQQDRRRRGDRGERCDRGVVAAQERRARRRQLCHRRAEGKEPT